jgi:predicted metal-dependent hydrolase
MADYHLPGEPPVPLTLRRSARARRISLRVSSLDGRVTLTLPASVPDREAVAFAAEKAGWIRDHLARHPSAVMVAHGAQIPVEGVLRRITPAEGKRVQLGAAELAVPGARPGRTLQRFLRELARDRLAEASDHYAARLGRSYARLTLRDTRSRWGSCSSEGGLMYSWRLIMAPPEVLRYVAAHEAAHLVEMNHSADFWALVGEIYGDYAPPRQWLRREGNGLHRYQFSAD